MKLFYFLCMVLAAVMMFTAGCADQAGSGQGASLTNATTDVGGPESKGANGSATGGNR